MPSQRVEVGPFDFRFQNVLLPMGLTVSNLVISGTGAEIEVDPFSIQLNERGTLAAEVGESELARFLETQDIGGLREISVEAKDGKLFLRAKRTLIVELKITATVLLKIVDGRQLWIEVESVEVMGAAAKNLVQSQISKINPVLDVGDFPIDAKLTEVEIADGKVILRGTALPPSATI